MSIALGLHAPYDARPTAATWDLLEQGIGWTLKVMGGQTIRPAIVVASHEPESFYQELRQRLPPNTLWYIRLKGNRWWWPEAAHVLDQVEYSDEATPHRRIDWLLGAGVPPALIRVVLWNEPDIELVKDGQEPGGTWWADVPSERLRAWNLYQSRAGVALEDIHRVWNGTIGASLAPLSEGNPERYAWWSVRYRESGLWSACTFRAEHAYCANVLPWDPDWGGRPVVCSSGEDSLKLPVAITECNDNGSTPDAALRANRLGGYARWLVDTVDARQGRPSVESLCLFILPGGARDADSPAWWKLDAQAIDSVGRQLLSAAPPVPTPPPPPPAPEPPPAPAQSGLMELHAQRWNAYRTDVPFNPETAITKLWLSRPELGAVLGMERDCPEAGEGGRGQAFAGGIVLWKPNTDAWVL